MNIVQSPWGDCLPQFPCTLTCVQGAGKGLITRLTSSRLIMSWVKGKFVAHPSFMPPIPRPPHSQQIHAHWLIYLLTFGFRYAHVSNISAHSQAVLIAFTCQHAQRQPCIHQMVSTVTQGMPSACRRHVSYLKVREWSVYLPVSGLYKHAYAAERILKPWVLCNYNACGSQIMHVSVAEKPKQTAMIYIECNYICINLPMQHSSITRKSCTVRLELGLAVLSHTLQWSKYSIVGNIV